MAADTIPNRLLNRAKTTPNEPAYYVREGGAWKPTNWGTYSDQVVQAGRALIAVMENYQTEDGGVAIPAVLQPYMKGATAIAPDGSLIK